MNRLYLMAIFLLIFGCAPAIHNAVYQNDIEQVKMLVERGESADTSVSGNFTPLMIASYYGYTDIARYLVDNGADVNQQNDEGWTALMFATAYGHTEIAEILLSKNADVSPLNNLGHDAFWYAKSYERHDIIKLMNGNGVNREQIIKTKSDSNQEIDIQTTLGEAVKPANEKLKLNSMISQHKEEDVRYFCKKYDFFCNNFNSHGCFKGNYKDNGDRTVTDMSTGLMWQERGSDRSLRRQKAVDYIEELNKSKFAGYSDWRLPSIEEIASLMTKEKNRDVHIDPVFSYNLNFA